MNLLSHSSSPYLQQHRDQPIEWYPWGKEALELARKDDRPILVSIGYSTCHWCHVMSSESFTDKDVADYMNFHFVNIKIDREERPDLDGYFMDVCQKLTGRGGWPLQVFLTPDLKPFFAGNYFPPEPGGRQMSWFQAMRFVVHNFRNNRLAAEKQGQRILDGLEADQGLEITPESGTISQPWLTSSRIDEYEASLMRVADLTYGGFGSSPKFPNALALSFLLERTANVNHPESLRHVMRSVQFMLRGGIYDQAGGGFARYAVDRLWKVPHFEKMLYDQALMVQLLADLIRHKPRRMYKRALRETLNFVERDLVRPDGGWFAALDADSDAHEGAYYTWSFAEASQCVAPGSSWLLEFFDVREAGNLDGMNILWQPHELYAFAEEHHLDIEAAKEQISQFKATVLRARESRIKPHRDEKLITDWNALMVSAYVKAGVALQEKVWIAHAREQMNCILNQVLDESSKKLMHVPQSKAPVLLSDYACTIQALLDLYLADPDQRWLNLAISLMEQVDIYFSDQGQALYMNRSTDQEEELGRRIDVRDEELPNANALLGQCLYLMGIYLDRSGWRDRARKMLSTVSTMIQQDPLAYASWYRLGQMLYGGATEIAVLGPDHIELGQKILQMPLPYLVMASAEYADYDQPLLRDKNSRDGQTVIFVCRGERCLPPVSTIPELMEMLSSMQ